VKYLCINIKSGEEIGTNVPELTGLPEYWKFAFYKIGDAEYKNQSYIRATVTDNTKVEVATMPDENGNDIDDRTTVILNVYAYGTDLKANPNTKPVKQYKVIDNAQYIVYDTETKENAPIYNDRVVKNPTNIVLPYVKESINDMPFFEWVFDTTDDNEDEVMEKVVMYPSYIKSQPVDLHDIIDDPANPQPSDKEDYLLPLDSYVIHRGIDGSELIRTLVTSALTEVVNPIPGTAYAQLPARNNGKPFAGWTMTIPTQTVYENGKAIQVTYLDPVYYADVPFAIYEIIDGDNNKQIIGKYDGITCYVPYDSTYQVSDADGNLTAPVYVKDEPAAYTYSDNEMPIRNANGDIFRGVGSWIVTVIDNNGQKNYIIAPSYSAPTASDIEVAVDESVYGNGNGVVVLCGAYREDSDAVMNYYVRIGGLPAEASDANHLTTTCVAALEFKKYASVVSSIVPIVTYDGVKDIDGVDYGVFEVVYTTQKSGIVNVGMKYDDITFEKNYYVVTVGNVISFNTLNSLDVAYTIQVVNDLEAIPAHGYNASKPDASFLFELMDVNRSGTINSVDVTELVYMVNGVVESN